MHLYFYNIFIALYPLIAKIISPINPKAKNWIKGRKHIFFEIAKSLNNNTEKKIWVHCASLGEFEQGRPLIEKIREDYPSYKIFLTFFSPSGFEVQKSYQGADYIFYLPMDNAKNASTFYNLVNPSLIIFIKYEFWYYYLSEAKKRGIPILLVSGHFVKTFSFFKWYGTISRKMLTLIDHLFVQTENSKKLLASIGISNVSVSGDTRFDRVLQIASNPKKYPIIEDFCRNNRVFVAGSTWTEDDELIGHFANTHPETKFIIAPHDISEERLKECDRLYNKSIRFSKLDIKSENDFEGRNILLIDNIGMLKHLYAYATICFVGGGYGGNGIHNILEAAVYGKPVLFGPENEKFVEAAELTEAGGAFEIADAIEFESTMNDLLTQDTLYREACIESELYVKSKAGATHQIINFIQEKRLLIN